jgi:hypothetical protein
MARQVRERPPSELSDLAKIRSRRPSDPLPVDSAQLGSPPAQVLNLSGHVDANNQQLSLTANHSQP